MDISIETDSVSVELPPDITKWIQALADKNGEDVASVILGLLAAGMDTAEAAA